MRLKKILPYLILIVFYGCQKDQLTESPYNVMDPKNPEKVIFIDSVKVLPIVQGIYPVQVYYHFNSLILSYNFSSTFLRAYYADNFTTYNKPLESPMTILAFHYTGNYWINLAFVTSYQELKDKSKISDKYYFNIP